MRRACFFDPCNTFEEFEAEIQVKLKRKLGPIPDPVLDEQEDAELRNFSLGSEPGPTPWLEAERAPSDFSLQTTPCKAPPPTPEEQVHVEVSRTVSP